MEMTTQGWSKSMAISRYFPLTSRTNLLPLLVLISQSPESHNNNNNNLISIAFSAILMSFNINIPPKVWRFLGFVSSVVGFICYPLSPSFHDLFGHWTLFTIILYSSLGTIFSVLTLFVNKCPQFSKGFLLKAPVGFLVLVLTSLYSFYEDRIRKHGEDVKVRRNVLSLVSFAAFAFMSVSLSKQIQPEFDVGMSNFFLGCLIVAVMKMNVKIALGVSALFYVLITVCSWCWESQIGDAERAIIMATHLSEIQSLAGNNGEEMPSLDNGGHEELDAIDEEIQQETDELGIWYQAFQVAQQPVSPLLDDEGHHKWKLFFH